MEDYTRKQLKKVEKDLVKFYNEALPYFEEICKETGISMPKAKIDNSVRPKGGLLFKFESRLEEVLDVVQEMGVKKFLKKLMDDKEAFLFILPA